MLLGISPQYRLVCLQRICEPFQVLLCYIIVNIYSLTSNANYLPQFKLRLLCCSLKLILRILFFENDWQVFHWCLFSSHILEKNSCQNTIFIKNHIFDGNRNLEIFYIGFQATDNLALHSPALPPSPSCFSPSPSLLELAILPSILPVPFLLYCTMPALFHWSRSFQYNPSLFLIM